MSQSLTDLNTLKLDASCERLVEVANVSQLEQLLPMKNLLVLGGGSNILFCQHFNGTVLLNKILGCDFSQDDDFHYISVGSGESWHQLVMTCCHQGIGGLENLALIPGSVGAAPIQNIGAYGVELANVCVSVEAYSLASGQKNSFSNTQCQFGYRDSMLKRSRDYFVTRVHFKLAKNWLPQLGYGELKLWAEQLSEKPNPLDVANQIIAIRQAKLPNHLATPNAGSFFKNPVVSQHLAQTILDKYPDCPQYPTASGVKIAAGWLIDQQGLKGFSIGGASVHRQQALVLINQNHATAKEFIQLATYIRSKVEAEFKLQLEPEVNFISATGYSDLDRILNV